MPTDEANQQVIDIFNAHDPNGMVSGMVYRRLSEQFALALDKSRADAFAEAAKVCRKYAHSFAPGEDAGACFDAAEDIEALAAPKTATSPANETSTPLAKE